MCFLKQSVNWCGKLLEPYKAVPSSEVQYGGLMSSTEGCGGHYNVGLLMLVRCRNLSPYMDPKFNSFNTKYLGSNMGPHAQNYLFDHLAFSKGLTDNNKARCHVIHVPRAYIED